MHVVEMLVSLSLMWGPPTGEAVEGPEPSEESGDTDGVDESEPEVGDTGEGEPEVGDTGEGEPGEGEPGEGEPGEGEPGDTSSGPEVDAIVEAAAQAAKDRAWLERNGREVEEYVKHLDALADVNAELDACGGAIQAELRMALALAYRKRDGTCSELGEATGEEAEDASDHAEQAELAELPMPVLECFEAAGPSECADRLLEHVAAFADEGPGGTNAPFSSAFGCPHAVAEMSVEQMFGSCMVEEYDAAVDRWKISQGQPVEKDVKVWPIPRWASITAMSGGAALVIAGAVLLGIDGKCPGGHDPVTEADQCPSLYKTKTGGAVLVSVGAVAMLGGAAVFTIVELQRRKQGKTRPTALRRRIDRAEALTGLRLSFPRPRLELRP